MCMRGKILLLCVLLISVLFLTACVRNINTPADELRMYNWEGETENGNIVSLLFSGENACLSIQFEDETLHIHGLCAADDRKLTICDEESGMNESFLYALYGDRVELNCNGGVLSLYKCL